METRRMWPEIVISGFVWLLVLLTLNSSPEDIRCQLQSIGWEAGPLTVLSGLIISTSYLLGSLVQRILSYVFEILDPEKGNKGSADRQRLMRILSKANRSELITHEDRYSQKLMFRSVVVGLFFLLEFNRHWILNVDTELVGPVRTILTCVAILFFLSFGAFWIQKKSFDDFNDDLERELQNRP